MELKCLQSEHQESGETSVLQIVGWNQSWCSVARMGLGNGAGVVGLLSLIEPGQSLKVGAGALFTVPIRTDENGLLSGHRSVIR